MSLLDKASLIVTPNSYKESKLYSVVPNTTLGDMDVVRATTATRVNSAGLIEVVPRNLAKYSEQFDNGDWIKASGASITANSVIAPNGTMTADTLNVAVATYSGIYQNLGSLSGQNTISIYAKKGTKDFLYFINLQGSTTAVWFNISNGTLGTVSSGYTATITDVGNSWYRCTLSQSVSVPSYFQLGLSDSDGSVTPTSTGTAYIWGAQLNSGSTATEYFPTTTRLNIPRIDYTNGSCPSLLVEPQRTNFYPYSQQLNQWSILGVVTVTENDAISPDGTQNADRAQFTLSTDLLYRSGTGSAGSNTLTVYAKAKSGTSQKFRFFGNGGLSYSSDQVATNQWQRFTFTYTYSATTAGLAGATTGAGDVLFYGFQHEIGTYATSYIPTIASSVTRNADVISRTGISSLIGQAEGTVFLEADIQKRNETDFYIGISNGYSLGEAIYLNQPSSGNLNVLFRSAGLAQTINILSANWNAGNNKIAIAYSSTLGEVFINGVSKGTIALTAIPTCNQIALGSRTDSPGGLIGAGPYKQAILFKTRLSNSELAQLTTL